MKTLLIADHSNDALSEATLQALRAATKLNADIDILVAGYNCNQAARHASKMPGIRKVLLAMSPCYEGLLPEPVADLIVSLSDEYSYIVAPATSMCKSALPRVAALLDVMQISEIIEVVSPDTFRRPTYAGNAIQTVQSAELKKVITVRTAAFAAVDESGDEVEIAEMAFQPENQPSTFVENQHTESDRPDLASAKIVVAGGRGLGTAEKFESYISSLADKLGAAVAASRGAVDGGFAPNEWQVGQTGKIVAPDLYLACGISGAIQHLAGMKGSRVIVAINKDEDAPIFKISDYGLVADLFDVLPALEKELEKNVESVNSQ